MLTVLNVLKNRPFAFTVPSNNIYEAGFVAKLASDAFFGVKNNFMFCINHLAITFLKVIPLFGENSGQQRRQVCEFLDIVEIKRS